MNAYYKSVIEYFKKQSIRYYVSESQSSLVTIYNHDGHTVNLKLSGFNENGFIIMAEGHRSIAKEHLAQGFKYSAEINFKRLMGTLEIDPEDGQWRYRLSLTLLGQKKVPAELMAWAISNCLTEFVIHSKVLDQRENDAAQEEVEEDLLDLLEEEAEEASPASTECEDSDEEEWVIQDEELRRILGED